MYMHLVVAVVVVHIDKTVIEHLLHSGVRSGTMAQSELPLPEVTMEDFLHAWKRFELVATAKEYRSSPENRAKVLPMLLQGKLVDIYIALNKEADMKKALMKKAGLIKDP